MDITTLFKAYNLSFHHNKIFFIILGAFFNDFLYNHCEVFILKKLSVLLLSILTLIPLSSCGSSGSPIASDMNRDLYQQSEYCGSNALESKMSNVCVNMKQIQTSSGDSVYPFDTALYLTTSVKNWTNQKINHVEELFASTIFEMHKEFDRHYNYIDSNNQRISNIKVINDSYGTGEAIPVSDDLFNLLEESIELTKLSQGKFNIAIGELSTYWDNFIEKYSDTYPTDPSLVPEENAKIMELKNSIPSYEEIDEVVSLDKINKTVTFNKYNDVEKLSLTAGAIGKGYAVEEVSKKLINEGITEAAISGGSSSINVLGKHPVNARWNIALSSQFLANNNNVGSIKMNEKFSISTSGDTVNRVHTQYNDEYKIRHHIINPTTGYSENYYHKVTLVSKELPGGIMDAASTVLMNCNLDEAKVFIQNLEDKYQCDVGAIFYIEENVGDTKLVVSNSLKTYFSKNKNCPNLEVVYDEI